MLSLEQTSVSAVPLLDGKMPGEVFAPFSEETGAMLLLSGGAIDADYSYICLDPCALITCTDGKTVLDIHTRRISEGDPLDLIDSYVQQTHTCSVSGMFTAGAVGYISYGYRTHIETVPEENPAPGPLPDVFFAFPSTVLVYSHSDNIWTHVSHTYSYRGGILKPGREFSTLFSTITSYSQPPFPNIDPDSLASDFTEEEYIQAVEKAREYIIKGEMYQANISQRFSISISGSPYPLFAEIFRKNPAPFFSFMNCGDHYILSSSPELLVRTRPEYAESKPIKGTAPRFTDRTKDSRSRTFLQTSTKDEAELSMIVDLIRNDLGKVCTGGSVRVKNHREIQAFSNVYHTLSTVYGTPGQNTSPGGIIRALFPGGSITGCPKIRAMEIIDEIEKSARHIYTGSIGYIGLDGCIELNIAIRTALIYEHTLYFSAGGGIVYDSDPKKEFDETTDKAATWLEVFSRKEPYGSALYER